jgi:hypothetical protein
MSSVGSHYASNLLNTPVDKTYEAQTKEDRIALLTDVNNRLKSKIVQLIKALDSEKATNERL